jgi:hypothetical protein
VTDLIVKETIDESEMRAILCNPVIYDTIASDECPAINEFEIPFDNHRYIGGFVNGEIIALMVYHTYKDGNKCHVQVLPEHRKEYGQKFGEQSLMYRGTQPLYAEIASLYQNVLDFALTFGFETVDKKIADYKKNGLLYDTYIMRFNDGIHPRFNW